MMTVYAVCAGHGRGRTEARKALDRYLPRRGDTTWAGQISSEGLLDMRRAVADKATRATAVACHLVGGKGGSSLLWIVGRRRAFGENGAYPVSATRKPLRRESVLSPEALLGPMCSLAALFHDLGKLSRGFQLQLIDATSGVRSPSPQPLRHELVSWLLLVALHRAAGARSPAARPDLALSDALSNREDVPRLLARAWEDIPALAQETCGAYPELRSAFSKIPSLGGISAGRPSDPRTLIDPETSPFFHAVGFLVLSHHRIPRGRRRAGGRGGRGWKLDGHVNEGGHARVADFIVPCGGWRAAVDGAWAASVAAAAVRSSRSLGGTTASPEQIASMSARIARIALIAADHAGSAAARPSLDGQGRQVAYGHGDVMSQLFVPHAKTQRRWLHEAAVLDEGRTVVPPRWRPASETPVLHDSWTAHTHKVSLRTRAAFATLGRLDGDLPALESEQYPAPSGLGRFSWQDVAVETLENALGEASGVPAMVFLVAGTGTGKTRAGCRLAAAGLARTRITSALGLRSLTKQTGEEYASRTGLPGGTVSTIMGDPKEAMIRAAIEKAQDRAEAGKPRLAGDESLLEADGAFSDGGNEPSLGDAPGMYESLPSMVSAACAGSDRSHRLLTSPVVACTADMLVPAGDSRRNHQAVPSMRLATSSLIIDEFDSYSSEDVTVLCRLVHLSGMAGQRVVISSATLPPALARAAWMAWTRGLRERAALGGQANPRAVAAWTTENRTVCETLEVTGRWDEDSRLFSERHGSFVAAHLEDIARREPARRARMLEMPDGDREIGIRCIISAIPALHGEHAILDPRTGRRLSLGFVRLNVTRDVRDMSRILMREGIRGLSVRVLCYHAKYPKSVRAAVDHALRRMTNRKHPPGAADPVLDDPHVRRALDDGGSDDVAIVVPTTSLIEVGRDFDFDWAITEMKDVASVVQSAGRVRRHRGGAVESPNVLVTSRPLDASSLLRQGMLRPISANEDGMTLDCRPSRDAASCLPWEDWANRLDAADCLSPRSMAARFVEWGRSIHLFGEMDLEWMRSHVVPSVLKASDREALTRLSELSLRRWLEDPSMSSQGDHCDRRRFRRRDGVEVLLDFRDGHWRMTSPELDISGTHDDRVRQTKFSETELVRSLLPPEMFDPIALGRQVGLDAESAGYGTSISLALRNVSSIASLRMDWNPLLGAEEIS